MSFTPYPKNKDFFTFIIVLSPHTYHIKFNFFCAKKTLALSIKECFTISLFLKRYEQNVPVTLLLVIKDSSRATALRLTREGFSRKNIVAVSFFQNCAIHQYS